MSGGAGERDEYSCAVRRGGYTPIIRDIGLTDSVSIKRRDAGERQVLSEVRDGTRDSVQVGEDRYVLQSVRRRANGISQVLCQVRCKERRSDSSSVCVGGTPGTTGTHTDMVGTIFTMAIMVLV